MSSTEVSILPACIKNFSCLGVGGFCSLSGYISAFIPLGICSRKAVYPNCKLLLFSKLFQFFGSYLSCVFKNDSRYMQSDEYFCSARMKSFFVSGVLFFSSNRYFLCIPCEIKSL